MAYSKINLKLLSYNNGNIRKLYFLILLVLSTYAYTQETVICKNGQVNFEASVASFEEIKASTNTGICAINTTTGEIAAVVIVKNLKFKNSLMQEHFNENYMESDLYPKAVFKGKIENYNTNDYSSATKINLIGNFEIHGKIKSIYIPATLEKEGSNYILKTDFILRPEDFNIDIPSIVGYKIAKTVTVSCLFKLLPK